MWYTYIIKSLRKKWYYVGSTNRIKARLKEHNNLSVLSTRVHAPLKLVYVKAFDDEKSAREYERLIKDKRKLKESLVRQIEKI